MIRISNIPSAIRAALRVLRGGTEQDQDRLLREAGKAFRDHDYELTQGGILLRAAKIVVGGCFHHRAAKKGEDWGPWAIDPNLFTGQGLNHNLNTEYGGQAQITTWYLAPFSGNVAPDASWTGANFTANATEFTAYTPTTRPLWDLTDNVPTTDQTLGNTGNEAVITFSAGGPYNVYGLGLISNSAKSNTSGASVLAAATRFDSPRLNQAAGDRLGFGYVITASDAG